MYEDNYEERFAYIADDNLRKHLGDALRYITETTTLIASESLPSLIIDQTRKTNIIYIASIIEANMNYLILRYGYSEYQGEFKYKDIKVLCELEEGDKLYEVVAGKRQKEHKKFSGYVDFSILNKFCYEEMELFDKTLYNKIEKIRKWRNKVHLMKLEDIDRKWTKAQLEEAFETTNELLGMIENKLINF